MFGPHELGGDGGPGGSEVAADLGVRVAASPPSCQRSRTGAGSAEAWGGVPLTDTRGFAVPVVPVSQVPWP